MLRSTCWSAVFAAVVLQGPSMAQGAPPAPKKERLETHFDAQSLIPRKVLFGNPDRTSPRISPDGARLAWLAASNGYLNVWVAPIADLAAAKVVTNDTRRGIRQFQWAYTNDHIVYLQDRGGDENFRVYSVNLTTGAEKDLTPFEKSRAEIEGVSRKFPGEMLIALNNRDDKFLDLFRVNIETGEMKMVAQSPGMTERGPSAGWVADDDFNVRFLQRSNIDDGSMSLLKPDGKGGWAEFLTIPQEDSLTTSPVGFDKTGRTLYALDSRGRDTAAFVSIDTETGTTGVLAEDSRADAQGAMLHPADNTVQAVAFNYERPEWKPLDLAVGRDLLYLKGVASGDVSVVSRSLDDKQWIVAFNDDDGPTQYWHFDRSQQQERFLFAQRPALSRLPLAKMFPVVIKSRDGLGLVSYLSLPAGSHKEEAQRPSKPLPMVLLVHGGPWARDVWGFNPIHQMLANRGYAVLSVNFRGSTGFGKQFLNAGNREWAAKMHDDLLDAVGWAVKEKVADPAKVAIMGGSYGGYATLVGMTFTPEAFACGVSIVGPSNLATLLNTIPPYWAPMVRMFKDRVGDHTTDEGRRFLESRSPLSRVGAIRRPLLIGQGANDPRVKQAESDQIVKAMQEKNIPVTYVLFPDEGHGFARPANNTAFFAVAEQFLSRHLGGRAEPIGDDFDGSSITVPHGAEGVPGLSEAMSSTGKR